MREWRLLGGMFLTAAALSTLVKYVLPQWVRQPETTMVLLAVLSPAALMAVFLATLGLRGRKA